MTHQPGVYVPLMALFLVTHRLNHGKKVAAHLRSFIEKLVHYRAFS